MKYSEAKSAKDIFEHKLRNSMMLDFVLDRFIDYQADDKNWRTALAPLQVEFRAFMAETTTEHTPKNELGKIVDRGMMFLATHPLFSISEFAKAGADLTLKEKEQFMEELATIANKPSKRKQVHPYIAVIGWEVVLHMMTPGSNLEQEVERRKADIGEFLAAGIIKNITNSAQEPWLKSIRMIDRLEDFGINIDKEGNVDDPKGLVELERKHEEEYAREQSKTGASEEGSTGISTTPESLN